MNQLIRKDNHGYMMNLSHFHIRRMTVSTQLIPLMILSQMINQKMTKQHHIIMKVRKIPKLIVRNHLLILAAPRWKHQIRHLLRIQPLVQKHPKKVKTQRMILYTLMKPRLQLKVWKSTATIFRLTQQMLMKTILKNLTKIIKV